MRSVLFLISIIFFIPQFSSAYCDVGEVTAQSARSGTLGSDFGQSAITNCENKNATEPVYYPQVNVRPYNYQTEIQTALLEIDRDRRLEEIKEKYDKKCVYEYTGANSHFDEKSGCVCNVGYVLYKGMCEGRDRVIDNVLDDAYYKALSNMPEYTNIANKEVVKSQAKNPANANLTIPQLIKKIYGDQPAVTTIVTTSTIAQTTKTTVPIKMTRAEYQAKYGKAPVIKSSLAENTKEDKMPPQIISTTSSTSSLEFSEVKIERSIPEVTNDSWFNKMVNWFKFKWLSKQS